MIITATITNLQEITKLALKLWPEHDFNELMREYQDIISNENNVIFLKKKNDKLIGFAQCGLRFDYVEEEYRRCGYAKELVKACEEWAKSKNIKEFASDCEINNIDSYLFHLKLGFIEANKIICFTKKIGD